MSLLTNSENSLLERLDLVYNQSLAGAGIGHRKSPRMARSAEFADFRSYVRGDDFRQIDWKAYARLDKFLLRLYVAEEEATLNLVLDTSASMDQDEKNIAMLKIATALGRIALNSLDRLVVTSFNYPLRIPSFRGKNQSFRLEKQLNSLQMKGECEFRIDKLNLKPGLAIFISDFLSPNTVDIAFTNSLSQMRQKRIIPMAWQILSDIEIDPSVLGDFRLIDPEKDAKKEVTLTAQLSDLYKINLYNHQEKIKKSMHGNFLCTNSKSSLKDSLMAGIRTGVLRQR